MANDGVAGLRVRIPGADVFVRVRGEGAGKPVVLLHGGGPGTSGAGWRDCMAACDPGLQLYAPDFPGFGESAPFTDAREPGNAAFVDATVATMDALCLDRVVLAGHSMGAAVAAALAARHPERVAHLVLVAPGGGFFGISDYVSPGLMQIARTTREPTEANVRALVDMMSYDDEAGRARQVARRMALLERPGIIETQRALLDARTSPSPEAVAGRAALARKVREFAGPVTLVWGAGERFNPFALGERIRDALPAHAKYCVVEGAGHNVQYDQPDAVARLLGTEPG